MAQKKKEVPTRPHSTQLNDDAEEIERTHNELIKHELLMFGAPLKGVASAYAPKDTCVQKDTYMQNKNKVGGA